MDGWEGKEDQREGKGEERKMTGTSFLTGTTFRRWVETE